MALAYKFYNYEIFNLLSVYAIFIGCLTRVYCMEFATYVFTIGVYYVYMFTMGVFPMRDWRIRWVFTIGVYHATFSMGVYHCPPSPYFNQKIQAVSTYLSIHVEV
jgi:hypothetical protein